MSEKKRNIQKGSRALTLSSDLHEDFFSIRNFGNFSRFAMHKYYHYFYSVAVGYSANEISKDSKIKETLEIMKDISKPETRAIESKQLEHHDDFFKTIAYWYKMKLEEKEHFKILIDPNEARRIAEMFFIDYWIYFKMKIENFSSDFPDIEILSLIEDKLEKIEED